MFLVKIRPNGNLNMATFTFIDFFDCTSRVSRDTSIREITKNANVPFKTTNEIWVPMRGFKCSQIIIIK